MKIKCPKCGKEFEVSGLGRKPRNITVEIVLNALQVDPRGYPLFAETAKKVGELSGVFVDRGVIYGRLIKEAECQGITLLELGRQTKQRIKGE